MLTSRKSRGYASAVAVAHRLFQEHILGSWEATGEYELWESTWDFNNTGGICVGPRLWALTSGRRALVCVLTLATPQMWRQ